MAQDAGIGAGVDSYFEYLVKGAILLQDEELLGMFLGKNRTTSSPPSEGHKHALKLVRHSHLASCQSTIEPFRTTRASTTGTCGSRCTKEPCPCLCSSRWRPSGPACRYAHRKPDDNDIFQCGDLNLLGLFQSLLGNLDSAVRTFQNYYSVWRQYGGLPEFYSIPQGSTVDKREGYPLRPGEPAEPLCRLVLT